MIVDGLLVPPVLVEAATSGRWVAPPAESSFYRDVFNDEVSSPQFLAPEQMRANRHWIDAMPAEYRKYYLGKRSAERPPGDMHPDQALLIGDLGPDQPLCLDFRSSQHVPSVIYLGTKADWIEVASNIEALLHRLPT